MSLAMLACTSVILLVMGHIGKYDAFPIVDEARHEPNREVSPEIGAQRELQKSSRSSGLVSNPIVPILRLRAELRRGLAIEGD